jgi:hypothetical protein
LLETKAYLLQMTFPVCVTSPNSLTLTCNEEMLYLDYGSLGGHS